MAEKPEVKKKCGVILYLPDDKFSLICDFCGADSFVLEDFRHHIKVHFSKTPMNIKREDSISCDSDCSPMDIHDKNDNFTDVEEREPTNQENVKIEQTEGYASSQRRSTRSITKNLGHGSVNNLHKEEQQCSVTGTRNASRDSTSTEKFKCSFCCKTFRDTGILKTHENSHTGKRPYKCHLCVKTFTVSSNLSRHIKSLHTKDRIECLVCEKRFINKSLLDIHTREKHMSDSDPRRYFPCTQCDDKFETKNQLSYHKLRLHEKNSANFTCDYCQRTFKNRRLIVYHMSIHDGTENYKCRHYRKYTFKLKAEALGSPLLFSV